MSLGGTQCKCLKQWHQARQSKCQPRIACTQLFQRHRHKSPQDKECTAWSRQQSSGPQRRQRTSQRRWPQPSWSTCPRRTADMWSRQWHPRQWSTCPRDRTSRQQRRQGVTWAQTFQRDIPGSLPSWCCQCWPCTFRQCKAYTRLDLHQSTSLWGNSDMWSERLPKTCRQHRQYMCQSQHLMKLIPMGMVCIPKSQM